MNEYPLSQASVSAFLPMADQGEILDRAGAILILLSEAYDADRTADRLAAVAKKPDDAPCWAGRNKQMFSDALRGVATLLALSRHLELSGGDDGQAS